MIPVKINSITVYCKCRQLLSLHFRSVYIAYHRSNFSICLVSIKAFKLSTTQIFFLKVNRKIVQNKSAHAIVNLAVGYIVC